MSDMTELSRKKALDGGGQSAQATAALF